MTRLEGWSSEVKSRLEELDSLEGPAFTFSKLANGMLSTRLQVDSFISDKVSNLLLDSILF